MPNYKLSSTVLQDMNNRFTELSNRRLNHARTDFPLTFDVMKRAVLPERWRGVILEMEAEGVSLSTGLGVNGVIEHPLLLRRPVVHVVSQASTRRFIYTDQPMQQVKYYVGSLYKANGIRPLDLSVIPPDQLDAMVKWVNQVVVEMRWAKAATTVVRAYLSNPRLAKSVGHVTANWPALTQLAPQEKDVYDKEWRRRFANPPNNLRTYRTETGLGQLRKVDLEWLEQTSGLRKIAEMIITSALLMDATIKDDAELTAEVVTWTKLPEDKDAPP